MPNPQLTPAGVNEMNVQLVLSLQQQINTILRAQAGLAR